MILGFIHREEGEEIGGEKKRKTKREGREGGGRQGGKGKERKEGGEREGIL